MKVPQITVPQVKQILDANGVDTSKACVLAIRGYYLDTMGKPGVNDRSLYDDAMTIWTPDGITSFQANTDPNGYRKGRGTGASKGMAMLKEGIHLYGMGPHKGKPAFRQCEGFTVIRDGNPPYEHFGFHAINLHSGGTTSTSSLGCQTIPASQWSKFYKTLTEALDKYDNPRRLNDWGQYVRSFDYVLLAETDRRKGDLVVSSRYL